MKTEQLIVQYLYSNKKVSVQDIGIFTIAGDLHIDTGNDKDTVLPADAIHFEFDPKAPADEGLINYIIQHTRKIRPLATSDLESFSMLNKQFLNIGKPLIMEGVGTLQKTQTGEYAFTQAGTSHVIHEEMPKAITEKQKEEVSFVTPQKEKNNGGSRVGIWLVVLVILAGATVAAWYFIRKREKENAPATETSVISADTSNAPTIDSAAAKKIQDSIAAAVKPAVPVSDIKDTNSFYMIVQKEFSTHDAEQKSYNNKSAYGYKSILVQVDSLHYNFRMPFKRPLTDTAHIKDSLTKFFSGKVRVELP